MNGVGNMNDRLGPYLLGPNDENQGIYTGDARELAQAIPDESVRLCFVDPPYWVDFDYGNGRTDEDMDFVEPLWIVETSIRIASLAMITCGIGNIWRYPEADWCLAWFKRNTMKRTNYGFNHWEPILAYGKPGLKPHEQRPDVIEAPLIVEKHSHACPKPMKLMLKLIDTFSYPGQTVIDLMVGSGTTSVAAKLLGRRWLAFEIDPPTADLARKRVRETQPPLFVPQPEQTEMAL